MSNQATELAIGDLVELDFVPFAATWEVVEFIDAGARFAYRGDVRFVGFDRPILAPNGDKLTENSEHTFVGRAHFAGLKRVDQVSTLTLHERPARNVEEDSERFWVCDLDQAVTEHAQALPLFEPTTVGVVDEMAGGIVAYAAENNARAIIAALRSALGEV